MNLFFYSYFVKNRPMCRSIGRSCHFKQIKLLGGEHPLKKSILTPPKYTPMWSHWFTDKVHFPH